MEARLACGENSSTGELPDFILERTIVWALCELVSLVRRNNVHQRIWPRASAAAERLWTAGREDQKLAEKRLEEHACRMDRRGLPAQPPNGAGFCLA